MYPFPVTDLQNERDHTRRHDSGGHTARVTVCRLTDPHRIAGHLIQVMEMWHTCNIICIVVTMSRIRDGHIVMFVCGILKLVFKI